MTAPATAPRQEHERGRRGAPVVRRRASVLGVLGELLMTAGVVVLLFLGWYLWLGDVIAGSAQNEAGQQLQEQWQLEQPPSTDGPRVGAPQDPSTAPVLPEPAATADRFATMLIPRFGADYVRTIAQGVGLREVLNDPETGIGHYPGTAMPGAVGNFAVAAHRTTYGAPFNRILDLQVDDSIFVETEAGWYQYSFRSSEIVRPSAVDVLEPVPRQPGVDPTERILTMTTCHPLFSAAERAIGYAVMTAWYPREGGAPAELVDLAAAAG